MVHRPGERPLPAFVSIGFNLVTASTVRPLHLPRPPLDQIPPLYVRVMGRVVPMVPLFLVSWVGVHYIFAQGVRKLANSLVKSRFA